MKVRAVTGNTSNDFKVKDGNAKNKTLTNLKIKNYGFY